MQRSKRFLVEIEDTRPSQLLDILLSKLSNVENLVNGSKQHGLCRAAQLECFSSGYGTGLNHFHYEGLLTVRAKVNRWRRSTPLIPYMRVLVKLYAADEPAHSRIFLWLQGLSSWI